MRRVKRAFTRSASSREVKLAQELRSGRLKDVPRISTSMILGAGIMSYFDSSSFAFVENLKAKEIRCFNQVLWKSHTGNRSR